MPTNFSDIKKFYNLITPKYVTTKKIEDTFYLKLKEILLEKKQSNSQIKTQLKELDKNEEYVFDLDSKELDKIEKRFIFYKEPGISATEQGGNNVTLLVYSSKSTLSPAITFSEDVDFFINAIPTIEMSKCSPYFDIYFEFDNIKNAAIDFIDQRKFFNGQIKNLTTDSNNRNIVGMEHMLLPQTMNTEDILYSGDSAKPDFIKFNLPYDKYAGILSVDGFNVDIRPSKGFMSFKTANANFRLHNRTFLRKFAQLFKPEYYSRVSVVVTYGWIHPDINSDNPYADFINSKMITREIYGVSNTSHSFESDGSVSIATEFFTKFSREILNIGIGANPADLAKLRRLARLSSEIAFIVNQNSYLQNQIYNPNSKQESLPQRLILHAVNGNPYLNLSFTQAIAALGAVVELKLPAKIPTTDNTKTKKKKKDKVTTAQTTTGTESATDKENQNQYEKLVESLVTNLSEFLALSLVDTTDITETNISDATKKISDIVKNLGSEIRGVLQSSEKKKLETIIKKIEDKIKVDYTVKPKEKGKQNIQTLLGENFSKKIKNKFDNIKNDAYSVSGNNDKYRIILEKEIAEREGNSSSEEKLVFKKLKEKMANKKLITLGYLFEVMVSDSIKLTTQFSNKTSIQVFFYAFNEEAGSILSNLPISCYPIDIDQFKVRYQNYIKKKGEEFVTVEEFFLFILENEIEDPRSLSSPLNLFYNETTEQKPGLQLVDNKIKSELEKFSILDSRKLPALVCTIECSDNENVLGQALITGKFTGKDEKENILRINIFDNNTNPFGEIKKIELESGQPNKFKVTYTDNSEDSVSETPPTSFVYSLNNFLSKNVPSINFGSSTSNVSSLTLSTNQNARDSAVRIIKYYKPDEDEKKNNTPVQKPSLPMRVIPAQMSVGLLGCPIIPYGQKLFVNLGTGTTIDSLYCVTGITHQINKGTLTTNLTMVVNDGFAQFENAVRKSEK